MKQVLAVVTVLLAAAALAGGRWDGSFQKIETLVTDGGFPSKTVPAGSYVKVFCGGANGAGVGINITALELDGGSACTNNNCELVRFDLGEKWYAQLTTTQNKIAAYSIDAGAQTCIIQRSLN